MNRRSAIIAALLGPLAALKAKSQVPPDCNMIGFQGGFDETGSVKKELFTGVCDDGRTFALDKDPFAPKNGECPVCHRMAEPFTPKPPDGLVSGPGVKWTYTPPKDREVTCSRCRVRFVQDAETSTYAVPGRY